jgi:hypothetical protein
LEILWEQEKCRRQRAKLLRRPSRLIGLIGLIYPIRQIARGGLRAQFI